MAVSQTILSAIALFLFNVHLVRCSPRALEERATCNADNVLRTFRASTNLADSLTFCSRYLSLPPVTTSTTIVGVLPYLVLFTSNAFSPPAQSLQITQLSPLSRFIRCMNIICSIKTMITRQHRFLTTVLHLLLRQYRETLSSTVLPLEPK